MADRFYVRLEVAGRCTQAQYDRLLELIDKEGPEEWPTIDGHLTTDIPEVTDGDLPEIEEFCTESNLEWHKHIEGKYDHNSVWVWWKPGMEKPNWGYANQEGKPTILLERLQDVLDQPQSCLATAIKTLIEEVTPPEIGDVEIIEE